MRTPTCLRREVWREAVSTRGSQLSLEFCARASTDLLSGMRNTQSHPLLMGLIIVMIRAREIQAFHGQGCLAGRRTRWANPQVAPDANSAAGPDNFEVLATKEQQAKP